MKKINHLLKSFIVGNNVLLVFYIFMASNTWAMPPYWMIVCSACGDSEDDLINGNASPCYCSCMYANNRNNHPLDPGPDADGDSYQDTDPASLGICIDNCPDHYNPNQKDADSDGTGDACDADTIYGTISGAVQGGVSIDINVYSCGTATTVATITTNEEGYYAVGGLGTDSYGILPQYSNYVFNPKTRILEVPQTDIRSYDFTATVAP